MADVHLAGIAVWYIATCRQCENRLPFLTEEIRDTWAKEHAQTYDPFNGERHIVSKVIEIWQGEV